MKIELGKRYKTRYANLEVRIYSVDNGGHYPVHGAVFNPEKQIWLITSWSNCGENVQPQRDLVEVSLYDDFKMDDPVYVWNETSSVRYRRHFAGISKNGKPMAFYEGLTSWTSDTYFPTVWDYCEKA